MTIISTEKIKLTCFTTCTWTLY